MTIARWIVRGRFVEDIEQFKSSVYLKHVCDKYDEMMCRRKDWDSAWKAKGVDYSTSFTKGDDESVVWEPLMAFPVDIVLMRWVNWQLRLSGQSLRIDNFRNQCCASLPTALAACRTMISLSKLFGGKDFIARCRFSIEFEAEF